jgi:hypothetical protein
MGCCKVVRMEGETRSGGGRELAKERKLLGKSVVKLRLFQIFQIFRDSLLSVGRCLGRSKLTIRSKYLRCYETIIFRLPWAGVE